MPASLAFGVQAYLCLCCCLLSTRCRGEIFYILTAIQQTVRRNAVSEFEGRIFYNNHNAIKMPYHTTACAMRKRS